MMSLAKLKIFCLGNNYEPTKVLSVMEVFKGTANHWQIDTGSMNVECSCSCSCSQIHISQGTCVPGTLHSYHGMYIQDYIKSNSWIPYSTSTRIVQQDYKNCRKNQHIYGDTHTNTR